MTDVAIVGGGVIGLAVAWRSAARGLQVTVVGPAPGSGASHVAAGMLAPAGEAQFGEEALLELGLESWRRYPAFVAALEEESGLRTGYLSSGSLHVACDNDELEELERHGRFRAGLGLAVQRLSSRECRALEPHLAPGIRGGLVAAGDCQVDPRALLAALSQACARSGVSMVRDAVTAVEHGSGRVAGVRTRTGERVASTTVVLAAGCWSAGIGGLPAAALPPVRPVKGQILRLAGADRGLAAHMIRGRDVYIVPRGDGRVVVGATVEERGFDTTVTAGAVHQLLRDAREMLPDVAELELVEASAGLRPGSPDNAPMIGPSALDGLLIATGHHRNGILLAPITADSVAAMLAGDAAPPVATGFAPLRFAPQPVVA